MTNQRYRNTYLDNHSHFCTASTVERYPMLDSDRICNDILHCWDKYRIRYSVKIEGFVIMPNHVHLLINGLANGVKKFMQYSLAESSRSIQSTLKLRAKTGDKDAEQWLRVIYDRGNGPSLGKVWKERFRCNSVHLGQIRPLTPTLSRAGEREHVEL